MSLNWVEKHSTNCKHCGHLVDERECVPEDDGDICQDCYNILKNERPVSEVDPLYPWWRCPNCGDKWLYPHQDNIDSSTCDNCAKEQSND